MYKHKAEKLYHNVLKTMEKLVGNKTTYDIDLKKTGKKLFGKRFVGVFPSDKIPKLKKNHMIIANLDTSIEPGSHWVGIVKDKKNITWVYDSYGRNIHKILPKLSGMVKLKSTERDIEQKVEEDNCGARSLAFLYVFDKHGIKYAKYI